MYKSLSLIFFCLFFTGCEQQQLKPKTFASKSASYQIASPPMTAFPNSSLSTPPQWIKKTNGNFPANAVAINNADGSKVYVCRVNLLNNLEPGEVGKNGCQITYGGKSLIIPNYEILVGSNSQAVNWRFPSNAPQQKKCSTTRTPQPQQQNAPVYFIAKGIAVPAPFSQMPNVSGLKFSCTTEPIPPFTAGIENNQPLYICVAIYHQAFHIGKLVGNQCSISGENNNEIFEPPYWILFE